MSLAQVLLPPQVVDPDAEAAAQLILDLEHADGSVIGPMWLVVGLDRRHGVQLMVRRPGLAFANSYTVDQLRLAIAAIRRDPPWHLTLTGLMLHLLNQRLQQACVLQGAD